MKIVRVLSVIALAAFLILAGILYMSETRAPMLYTLTGILALGAGALMFISLSHWIDFNKER